LILGTGARRPTADLRPAVEPLLAAAQQPTENVADRPTLVAAEHAAQDAAEGIVSATGRAATEQTAQDVTDATGRCCLGLRAGILLGELLADVGQHDRGEHRQQTLDQVTARGAAAGQRRCDLIGVIAAEQTGDELVALALIELIDVDATGQ
jgi:N-methylhydantoinase B/oxoprolinase/acetone carboxylase alpha subunit